MADEKTEGQFASIGTDGLVLTGEEARAHMQQLIEESEVIFAVLQCGDKVAVQMFRPPDEALVRFLRTLTARIEAALAFARVLEGQEGQGRES